MTRRRMRGEPGKVWLVGAGPGDPELLTLKAARVIGGADVIAYDELVSEEVLAWAPEDCERVPVGRRAAGVRHHPDGADDRIHPVVIERAREGKCVVRLKGGDPFVFGRGGEELEALAEAGIEAEVIPGITTALGAAASQCLPLTHRGVATSVTLMTAHRLDDRLGPLANAPRDGTLAIYMGATRLSEIARTLIEAGFPADLPACVIESATTPRERATHAMLATLGEVEAAPPAIVLVGEAIRAPHRRETCGSSFTQKRSGLCAQSPE